jgi:DNA end-binding protein Ku
MRAVWKGTIGFGSAAIPVKAYSATEERSSGLHQLHLPDGGRIRYKRVCEVDGAEIPAEEIGRGYEMPGGDVVVLTDEDFASLPLPTTHSIDICAFTPLEQIDPVYFAKSYYLEPDVAGTKSYVLLAEAMQQADRSAVVKVALRGRETLGALRVRDQLLVLETMLWPDEIRRPPDFPFLHQDVDVRLGELRAAANIIENLATDFAPEEYTDQYQEALDRLIQAKAEGSEVVQPAATAQNDGVAKLLAALQDSAATLVEENEGQLPPEERSEQSEGSEQPPENGRKPVRKPSVRKAKAAEEKAAASKDQAKKATSKTRSSARPRR